MKAQKVFESIATSGAAGGSELGVYVSAQNNTALQELVQRGLIAPMRLMGREDHQHFTLTNVGRSFFKPAAKVHRPVSLLAFQRPGIGKEFDDYTTVELVCELTKTGWRDHILRSKNVNPYVPQGDKVWYRGDGDRASRLYLQCLLRAGELFNLGAKSIYHFQPQAYYKALLSGEVTALPHQPLAYYRLLKKRKEASDKEPQDDDLLDAAFEMDDVGFLVMVTVLVLFNVLVLTIVLHRNVLIT